MSRSLYEPGAALLAALVGNSFKEPQTLEGIVREVEKIAEQADKLARELPKLYVDDHELRGLLHRVGAVLRDTHTSLTTALAGLSPEVRERLQ